MSTATTTSSSDNAVVVAVRISFSTHVKRLQSFLHQNPPQEEEDLDKERAATFSHCVRKKGFRLLIKNLNFEAEVFYEQSETFFKSIWPYVPISNFFFINKYIICSDFL